MGEQCINRCCRTNEKLPGAERAISWIADEIEDYLRHGHQIAVHEAQAGDPAFALLDREMIARGLNPPGPAARCRKGAPLTGHRPQRTGKQTRTGFGPEATDAVHQRNAEPDSIWTSSSFGRRHAPALSRRPPRHGSEKRGRCATKPRETT
ncbi:hypothetical protein [Pseudogemmobacter sonorensis]|uniref:hypothetical protein n=1 Tax=Pseudogemmobacter sonorensis TaxID=2989681 RepID=UPI00367680AC